MEDDSMPIYVKVENYKDVLDLITIVKEKLNETKSLLNRLHELKAEEDAEIELWSSGVDEIEQKVENIDKMLYEPNNY